MTATAAQDAARKIFVAGLEDIHAIQRDAKAMMLKVIDRLDHYPEARERLKAHLGDKEREMSRAEQILSRLGEKPSAVKDGMFKTMGGATAMLTGMADDDILKSSMLTFALAEYEIALYESLLTLAEPAGAPDARPLLEESLAEEKNMAEWLHAHLQPTVMRYVELKGAGQPAAH